MTVAPIFPVLLLVAMTRCKCGHTSGYNTQNGNSASQLGTILKPPPPPQLMPMPFHLPTERSQRQTSDVGYQYQAPPPPPSNDFKFPAPFYKQYNFNFVPPPQPFSTTPAPSMFQKVSGWLFSSQQTNNNNLGSPVYNSNNNNPFKKDCNPCNLVPWLPVIRYNVGAKSVYQNSIPTYGPPSPTAYADALKAHHKYPQSFNTPNQDIKTPQAPPVPHAVYGPPAQNYNNGFVGTISSTYGPPSATHTLDVLSPKPPSSTFSQPSSSYMVPSSPFNSFNSQFISTPSQDFVSNSYSLPSSTYRPPSSSYGTPAPIYGPPVTFTTTYQSITPQNNVATFNHQFNQVTPQHNDVELLENITPVGDLQLPKLSTPTTFKNSYGEPITNTHLFDISYPISAAGAETTRVKTQVLPNEPHKPTSPNMSFALANPAPFTSNRGRNIHTLQPVALPNLSVSPLPPIFNARPFRPAAQFSDNILQGINQMQQPISNVNIQQSVPIAEYTHSVDYPATIIQSPIIEIDPPKISNQTKGYRNIPNSYVVDEIRDISSQASEDHISATKSVSDASFEITGSDVGNELYDSGMPMDMKPMTHFPSNHQPGFADLRGVNDEDVDKYRTENNLQNIDSPLLYLKPSAPHKSHGNFIIAVSSPVPNNDYEIYDDSPTTPASNRPTLTTWDESKTNYDGKLFASLQNNKYKPKVVQIIVPYTTGNEEQEKNNDIVEMAKDWPSISNDEYQARKVPENTDSTSYTSTVTENYSTEATTTENHRQTETENYDSDLFNPTDNNVKDLYDIKEPPFDIIKLQHTIDDWTEQEYSKQYQKPQKTRNTENYAKKIPDDFFTTTVASNYVTTNYNYEFYDHEGSSSVHHAVTDDKSNTTTKVKPRKEYNIIDRPKTKHTHIKNYEPDDVQKLHIYTAASSFRTTSTTTTPAPWGKIQTSISPLTKEKVYVVTSKPWRESRNVSKDWYEVEQFESKKTNADSEAAGSSNYPFKSPRFMSRPSFGFTSGGKIESDSSYGYSKSWFQSINELETQARKNSTSLPEITHQNFTTNLDEATTASIAKIT